MYVAPDIRPMCDWTNPSSHTIRELGVDVVHPWYHLARVPMKHMTGVIQQLKRRREDVRKQLQRIDAALAALGSIGSNGASRHTLSAAARKRISLA